MDTPHDIPPNPFIIRDIRELSAIPALPKVDSKPFFDIPINFSAIEQENVFTSCNITLMNRLMTLKNLFFR